MWAFVLSLLSPVRNNQALLRWPERMSSGEEQSDCESYRIIQDPQHPSFQGAL
jgi:hypothetical protein